jgi:hypothetical protein
MQSVRRYRGPRSRAGKIALLALALAAMGYVCARLSVLLADVRPYMGWYWLLAVVAGIAVAVGLPWAFIRGFRGSARWPGWLLVGYLMALGVGLRYYLSVRFNAPSAGVPVLLPQPPLWFALVIAGLTAVMLTYVAITLLLLLVLAEAISPGLVGGRIGAWSRRRPSKPLAPGPVDERIPARIRLTSPDGAPAGQWLRGEIQLTSGSLLWKPVGGVQASPLELAQATIVSPIADPKTARMRTVTLTTAAGQIQVDHDADTFALLQRTAVELGHSSPATLCSAVP